MKTEDESETRLKLKSNVSATTFSEAVKEYDVAGTFRGSDGLNKIPVSAVFPVDPNQNPALTRMPCAIVDSANAATALGLKTMTTQYALGYSSLPVYAGVTWYDPALGITDLQRTPTVYKNVQTAANGATAIWTAGVGKRWRLMGGVITLGQATTAAAGVKVSLYDVAADTGIGVTLSTAALAAVPNTMIVLQFDIKNGILAAATNTALNVFLSSAMAVNGVSVQVWGTEE